MNEDIFEFFKRVKAGRIAVVYKGDYISFGELAKISEQLALSLKKIGCKKSAVVGFLLKESPELIYSLLAVAKIGGAFFSINVKYPKRTIQEVILRTAPQILIVDPLLISKLGIVKNKIKKSVRFSSRIHLLSFELDRKISREKDTFAILFTSGTTDTPKGVYHRQQDFIFVGERSFSAWEIKQQERFLSCIPLFSAATLGCILIPSLCYGQTLVLPEGRGTMSLVKAVNEEKTSFIIGTPTSFIKIMRFLDETNQKILVKKIRGTVTGATIASSFVQQMEEKTGIELYPHYGMTELLAVTSVSTHGDFSTVGKPLKDINLQIAKNGEVLVKSPAMSSGYLENNLSPLVKDGWFHTKDNGMLDKNRNLKILGRMDDMVNRGGNNIYPSEIENVLKECRFISCSGVIGVPDPTYGEKVVAFVVPTDSHIRREKIRAFLSDRLPVFKIPDEIIFIKRIPKTESGKVVRKELKLGYAKLRMKSN
ncbi:MAG: acyl--CoA ligase [Candidatus Helarchaeota archaeon]|nr:acyl--CoA ligase [Candidatus Helarchaeota archaeon]